MSDEIREQVSAMADDELSDIERPLLLGRLQRDPELRACLGRYQLIGEVMRGGTAAAATLGVADRVQRALAADVPMNVPAARRDNVRLGWVRPVSGVAIAASVALVAVLSVSSLRETETQPVPKLAAGQPDTGPGAAAVAQISQSGEERWERLDPRIDQRLSGYLVNHNEYAASRGVQGVMPYVRIVGYNTSE
jgi:sigma-E factor negative regulatory protein RseA